MRIKMVIADDERLIRESLYKLMDWESVGVEAVGAASNGKAALELVREHEPKILLSDICMPEMDGIEILAKIQELELGIYVIFLSAHSDFAYAQSALKYGAFDYLLKPIDEELLMQTVSRCVGKIRREERFGANRPDRLAINMALCNLLTASQRPTRQEEALLNENGLFLMEGVCIGALIPGEGGHSQAIPPLPEDLEQIIAQNTAALSDTDKLLLWSTRTLTKEKLMRRFMMFLEQIDEEFYISNPHSVKDIKRVYAECAFARLYPKLGLEARTRRYCDGAMRLSGQYPHVGAREVLDAIQKNDIGAIKALVNRMFWGFAQRAEIYDADLIKLKCITLLDGLKDGLHLAKRSAKEPESDVLITAKKLIQIQRSIGEIYDETIEALYRLCKYYEHIGSFGGSWLVAQTIEYIKENYRTVSLAEIARTLYVSPAYLSRVFAAETRETFSRCVQKYRMKIDKELLLDPQYKIYNVAQMVGYSDVTHFSKAFKQTEGITPKKYKDISYRGTNWYGDE